MSDMEKRIQGRKIGEEVIAEYIHGEDEAWVAGFRRACENFVKKQESSSAQEGMSDVEADRYERQTIRFGKHAGKTIREVPIDYLTWLVDQQSTMVRYLKSARGKKRIESEDQVNCAGTD